jgi:3alpha(or 20beta)-hydroxysteroid dehydrogenase
MTSGVRIDGKVAIVTGGGNGQGAVTARFLRDAGGIVYITDVDSEASRRIAAEADLAAFLHHDVREESSWQRVVDQVLAERGRIDVLVNNAGIIAWETLTESSTESWQRVIDVNQTGPYLGMRAVAPTMKAQGSGSIVNISSIAGLGGSSACFAYGATKWAVRGMTRGAAQELGPFGIRVNAVLPGTIESRMIEGMDRDALAQAIPLGRIGLREEVARLTLWLASDESAYASGADFLLDGGAKA